MTRYIWISLILIITACLSTFLMLNNNNRTIRPKKKQLARRPNAFMLNARYYEYDNQGLLHSRLTTSKVLHYLYKNSARFKNPTLMIYTAQHIPWYISAYYGESYHGTKSIHLWDHVVIHQPKQAQYPDTTITTSAMTIYPNQSSAETNQDVTIIRPNSIVQATGMKANLKKGNITLRSHARGVYETLGK